ncbi:hypothetical protein LTS18_014514 [Coniosporium uncinatum]|uniref:Uncharacterized protein n=1 Tax=Coniosporium uncinatum TaxID=93489 RepID=A0ACC3CV89_9PEZI|nr:hypothetical protein LTS18_014514 [Coniosporium uncinatum]
MAHDFNREQPVKGAQAYFMHQIMQGYNDDTCIHILKQIVPAMKPGHSKLVVCDLILSNRDAHWLTTTLDLELMQVLASRSRTESEFRKIDEAAGLKISGIYKHPQGYDSVIEAVLP